MAAIETAITTPRCPSDPVLNQETNHLMFTSIRRAIAGLSILAAVTAFGAGPAMAQENPPPKPIELPCATNAFAQVLGASPVGDGSQTLVQARVIFGEGGSIGLHTHPGTLVMTVETGSFGFTHMGDSEMTLNRAATSETDATTEPMPHGEEVAVNPGDWFVETGMVHTGANLSDGETTVLISGLIETGQPLTMCVDEGATPVQHAKN
jgi:hypothetical protein